MASYHLNVDSNKDELVETETRDYSGQKGVGGSKDAKFLLGRKVKFKIDY